MVAQGTKKQADTSQGHGNISADRSAYGIAEKKCIFEHNFSFKQFVLRTTNYKINTIRHIRTRIVSCFFYPQKHYFIFLAIFATSNNYKDMDIHQKTGLAIVQLRKEQGISQYNLAIKANITFRYLSDHFPQSSTKRSTYSLWLKS